MKSPKHTFNFNNRIILFLTICFFQFHATGQIDKPETFTLKAVKLSDAQIDENQTKEIIDFLNRHQDNFQSFENERMTLMPFTEASKASNASLNKRINDFSSNKGFLYGDITQTNFYQEFSKDLIEHLRYIENRENRLQQERKLAIEKSKNHNKK